MAQSHDDKKGRRKALGKGLGALIPKQGAAGQQREFLRVPLTRVATARQQPRTRINDAGVAELASSIRESGLIQPIVVRQKGIHYEIIAGERRFRACQIAGVTEVPVVVKDVNDTDAYTLALVENIQREDLDPLDEARAYEKLLAELNCTQSELAGMVGKSRPAVANALRLLKLPETVQDRVAAGELSAGHARALVVLESDEAEALAEKMAADQYSVREAEDMARRVKDEGLTALDAVQNSPLMPAKGGDGGDGAPSNPGDSRGSARQSSRYRDDAQIRAITRQLQQALGTRVKVKDVRGKGRIEIHYDDYDVLQSVLDRLLDEE